MSQEPEHGTTGHRNQQNPDQDVKCLNSVSYDIQVLNREDFEETACLKCMFFHHVPKGIHYIFCHLSKGSFT